MNRRIRSGFFLLLLPCAALSAAPASERLDMDVLELADQVVITSLRDDVDLSFRLVGPGGAHHTERFAASEPIVVDLSALGAGAVVDGLYKYEVRPVALVKRDPDEVPANLRGLVNTGGPEIEPFSGSFRVVDGEVVVVVPDELEASTGGLAQ